MTSRCLDLASADSLDPTVVGGKAAGLARARAAGLPVLPGVVVPVTESQLVVDAVLPALEGGGGKARLAAMTVHPDEPLIAELCGRLSPSAPPFIVRSSSPLEADGTWSGAFSSFNGITPEELATAVRGCWGSAFSPTVLDRAQRTGTPPDQLGLAVLVQPELRPDLGGIARLGDDGTVHVTATDGPLYPLMAGHVEGRLARVGPDGTVVDGRGCDSGGPPLDDALLRRVAQLSREVGALLGHHLTEWAGTGSDVVLLQSVRSRAPAAAGHADPAGETSSCDVSPADVSPADPSLRSPIALRIATLTQRFGGRLAEELLHPWAVALPSVPALPPVPVPPGAAPVTADAVQALASARSTAGHLTSVLWGGSPRAAEVGAGQALRMLRGDDPAVALQAIARLPQPDPAAVAAVLGHVTVVRDTLVARGLVESEAEFWRLGADDVRRALAGDGPTPPTRLGVGQWEPFLYSVVTAQGAPFRGVAAAPGAGAGRAHVVDGTVSPTPPAGRYVLVAAEPSPALAPLLWNAAGLVTRAGSAAAHLIEFAHSIGVPTVVQCDLPHLRNGDSPLIAVDGRHGLVSMSVDGPGTNGSARTVTVGREPMP